MSRPIGFAQKRGQTPDPLWLESGFALPVGRQSPFLGKARPIGQLLIALRRITPRCIERWPRLLANGFAKREGADRDIANCVLCCGRLQQLGSGAHLTCRRTNASVQSVRKKVPYLHSAIKLVFKQDQFCRDGGRWPKRRTVEPRALFLQAPEGGDTPIATRRNNRLHLPSYVL